MVKIDGPEHTTVKCKYGPNKFITKILLLCCNNRLGLPAPNERYESLWIYSYLYYKFSYNIYAGEVENTLYPSASKLKTLTQHKSVTSICDTHSHRYKGATRVKLYREMNT